MLIYFNDALNDNSVAINPKFVTVVFVAPDGDFQGKTVISTSTGNILTNESLLDVVGKINGALA